MMYVFKDEFLWALVFAEVRGFVLPPRLGMARRPAIEGISVVGTQEVKGVARKKDGTRVPDVYTVR